MSLFNRALRPPSSVSDAAIERYLSMLRSEIEVDPLFRRRLRSDVVNQFVAAREGTAQRARPEDGPSQMGRLGRACLYATFVLGVGSTSALAAAEHALPGDMLYPLKLRIEQVRLDVLPDHLHGELAGYALGQRIEEMARLAESGRVGLAVAMAPAIDRAYEDLVALGESAGPARAARIARHLVVLDALLARLPPTARDAVADAMSHERAGPAPAPKAARGSNGLPMRGGVPTGEGPGSMDSPRSPSPTPRPTPKPESTPTPASTPRPERTAKPEPTGRTAPSRSPGAPEAVHPRNVDSTD
jgi:hypothetical protein